MEFAVLLAALAGEVVTVIAAVDYARRARSGPAIWLAVASVGTLLLTVVSGVAQTFILPVLRVGSQASYGAAKSAVLAIQAPLGQLLAVVMAVSLLFVLRQAGSLAQRPRTEQALQPDASASVHNAGE